MNKRTDGMNSDLLKSCTKPGWMARLRLLSAIFLLLMSSGCMAQKMRVTVVVVNYTSHEIGNVYINDQPVFGTYASANELGPGGGGGGHTGLMFAPGLATVTWMIGGEVGEPMAGERRAAKGTIPEPPDDFYSWKVTYLGLRIYPNEEIQFTLTRDIPYSVDRL